jgi:hypothetical protein
MDARSTITKFSVLTARPNDNINGLVYWGTFDDGTAVDWSGYQNNGTLVNAPTVVPGIIGNALLFASGSSQRVTIPALSALSNTTTFTWGGWFKRAIASGLGGYLSQGTGTSSIVDIELYSDGNVYCSIGNASTIYGYFASNDTNWHQIYFVYNGSGSGNAGRLLGFLDGKQQTLSFTGTIPSSIGSIGGSFYISYDTLDSPKYSSGSVGDVRVYNRALFPGEINATYNQVLAYQQGQPEGELPALYLAQTSPFLINPLIITAEQPVLHPFPMVAARSVQGPNVGTPEFRKLITSQEQTEYYYTRPITRAGVYTTGFNPVWAIKSNIIFPGPAGT